MDLTVERDVHDPPMLLGGCVPGEGEGSDERHVHPRVDLSELALDLGGSVGDGAVIGDGDVDGQTPLAGGLDVGPCTGQPGLAPGQRRHVAHHSSLLTRTGPRPRRSDTPPIRTRTDVLDQGARGMGGA